MIPFKFHIGARVVFTGEVESLPSWRHSLLEDTLKRGDWNGRVVGFSQDDAKVCVEFDLPIFDFEQEDKLHAYSSGFGKGVANYCAYFLPSQLMLEDDYYKCARDDYYSEQKQKLVKEPSITNVQASLSVKPDSTPIISWSDRSGSMSEFLSDMTPPQLHRERDLAMLKEIQESRMKALDLLGIKNDNLLLLLASKRR